MVTYNNKLNQSKDRVDDLERYASLFRGEKYFDGNDGAQNSLVFQVRQKYFKNNFGSDTSSIELWKSKGLSNQSLSLAGVVGTANNIKMSKPKRPAYVIFNRKESFFCRKKENAIVYSLYQKTINSNNALKNCLFGATKVAKPSDTTDPDKYIYSGYGLGYDSMG